MARVFAAGSSEVAKYDTNAPVTSAPLTMAAWARCTDGGSSIFRRVISIGDKDVTNNTWDLYMREFFGRTVLFAAETGAGEAFSTAAGNWSQNTWAHVCGVEASSTSRTAYLNGSAGTADTTSRAPSGVDGINIGGRRESSPASSEFFTGDIAEVGVWNVALTQDEITSLANGASPLTVRPAALVFYVPMIGRYSPEIEIKGNRDLTLTGTSASAHPRIFYPHGPHTLKASAPATTGVGPLLFGGSHMHGRLLHGGRLVP